jgi:hypothetical protein
LKQFILDQSKVENNLLELQKANFIQKQLEHEVDVLKNQLELFKEENQELKLEMKATL